jgi:SAM-dependent methyltransferase
MTFLYGVTRKTWRTLAHLSGRQGFLSDYASNGKSQISRLILLLKSHLERTASHDAIYDDAYYRKYIDEMSCSADAIVASIMTAFHPKTVIDVGCGSGEIIGRFGEIGVKAIGLDYAEAALSICRKRGLDVLKVDLEAEALPNLSADVVVSTEVAEHLPERCADKYVDFLCSVGTLGIVITAATPGQGGTDHVNEQPYTYWIDKFGARGAHFENGLTEKFRSEWFASGVELSRAKNVLVFSK